MPEQILTVKVISDTSQAQRDLKGLDRSTTTFGKNIKQLAKFSAIGFGIQGGVKVLTDATAAASSLGESINAVQVVFGDAADTILDFSSDTSDAVFETAGSINQLTTVTGALLQNMGFSADEAADATVRLTQRAADMASVHDTSVADALSAINSALRRQSEPITRYAADTRVASIEAQALADGLIAEGEAMDDTTFAAAAINKIMADTAVTQGDAARTAGSNANQQRQLAEQYGKVQVQLGEKLLPVQMEFQQLLIDLAPIAVGAIEAIEPLIELAGDLAEGISWVVDVLPEFNSGGEESESMLWNLINPIDGMLTPLGLITTGWDTLSGIWSDTEPPRNMTNAVNTLKEALPGLVTGYEDTANAATQAEEAQQSLADRQRADADPVFGLIYANRKFQEVLNDVEADGVIAGEEITRLAEATFDLTAAQERYAAEGSTEGLEALADAGRISAETLATNVAWLQEIDGYTATARVNIDVSGIDPGAFAPTDLPVGNPLEPVFLHSGGIVRAPTLAVVGDGGPEAVVPLDGPNAPAMGGNTYHIRVEAGISDPTAVADAVAEAIDRYEARNGTRFRGVG